MKGSKKGIHILASTPALRERLIRIFQNLDRTNRLPFPIELIRSPGDAKETHLLFFEPDLERMEDSKRELHQLIAIFRSNVVLMCPTEHDNLKLASQFGIGNILMPGSLSESIVRAVTVKLLGEDFFGCSPFFPNGYTRFEKTYSFSGRFQVKDFPKNHFQDFVRSLDPEERHYFSAYVSELMTNALIYSVYEVTPEERDQNQTGFPTDVIIPKEKEIRIRIVRDDEKYGISIADKTGALTLLRVLEKIQRQTTAPDKPVPEGVYDLTGRGFFILSKQTRLIINIQKRVKTEIILLRYNDPSLNKYQALIINEK